MLIACPDIRDYGNYFWDIDWSHGYPTSPQRLTQLFVDFQQDPIYSGSLHFGSTKWYAAATAHVINSLIPTRLLDKVTMRLFKRPLATGIKVALVWGLTFVVVRKPL